MNGLGFVERGQLLAMTRAHLIDLKPYQINRSLAADEVDHILRACGSTWTYKGEPDPNRPHAQLTTGKCSNGYVNVGETLVHATLNQILCDQLVRKLSHVYMAKPAWVVGSDHAGAPVALEIARQLLTRGDFTEKSADGKTQIWKRFAINYHEPILQVEELINSTTTVELVKAGLQAGNPGIELRFVPYVLTIVNRSGRKEWRDGRACLSLVDYKIDAWEPADCPLCKAGSKPLRPKAHWAELTAV